MAGMKGRDFIRVEGLDVPSEARLDYFKFYKIWRGPYTVVKVLSRLNLKLQAGAYGKTIVVHVDRVKYMNLHDEGVIFDANRNALSLDTPNPVPPSGTFKANERDSTVDICAVSYTHLTLPTTPYV